MFNQVMIESKELNIPFFVLEAATPTLKLAFSLLPSLQQLSLQLTIMIPVIVNSIFLHPVTQPILQILNAQLILVLHFIRICDMSSNLPRRNQDMVENMHRTITSKRIRKCYPVLAIQLN